MLFPPDTALWMTHLKAKFINLFYSTIQCRAVTSITGVADETEESLTRLLPAL
jgi:hypothetical protein